LRTLADALVFAVSYIDSAPASAPDRIDDDVQALESIAAYLGEASAAELDALAAAADRQAHEARAAGDDDTATKLDTWMEDTCGEPWVGNQRAL
jgi:hypothetical protein